jgi:hypothetical protein
MKVFAIIVAFLTAGVIASPTVANKAAANDAEDSVPKLPCAEALCDLLENGSV